MLQPDMCNEQPHAATSIKTAVRLNGYHTHKSTDDCLSARTFLLLNLCLNLNPHIS